MGGRGGGGCLLEKYPANVFLGARRSLEKYPANEGASVGFTLGFPFFLLWNSKLPVEAFCSTIIYVCNATF